MGIWTTIKGIFAAPKVLDAGLDTLSDIRSGIDKIWYTEEERVDDIQLAKKEGWEYWLKTQAATASENSARAITRRMLAKYYCIGFLILIFWAGAAYPISKEYSAYLLSLVKLLIWPTGAVITFYFGPYQVGQYLMRKKKDE